MEFGSPAALTAAAVYLHGSAGDKAAQKFGEYGMTPEDLIGCIPEVLKEREQYGRRAQEAASYRG